VIAVLYGFWGKLLRINLSTSKYQTEDIAQDLLKRFLGGANLALHYLLTEMESGVDPFGEKNKLIFVAGLGAGIKAPGLDMHMVLAKSPLTGGIGESQSTGWWGSRLKKAGWDLVIIEGKALHPTLLILDDGRVTLQDATTIWGRDTYTTQSKLNSELGEDFSIAQIGPAGEKGIRYASIVNDLVFVNNRMGLGGVMGSKNLKAIAVRGTKKVPVADEVTTDEIFHFFEINYLKNPINALTSQKGIAEFVPAGNSDGLFSVQNAQSSFLPGAEQYSVKNFLQGGTLASVPCMHCPAQCKKKIIGNPLLEGHYGAPSMESIVDFGFTLNLVDPILVGQLHEWSRKYGFDSTSLGVTLGFIAECFAREWLSPAETNGLQVLFGHKSDVLNLVEDMVLRRGFGYLIGEGVGRLSHTLGERTATIALQVKGKELPLHEPRVKQMLGLGYAVAPHGPDTFIVEHDIDFDEKAPQVFVDAIHALGLTERLPAASLEAKKIRMYYYLNQVFSFMDALGMCIFAFAPVRFLPFSRIPQLIQSITGWETSLFGLMKIGEMRITLQRLFNLREGLTVGDDWLPDRLFEPIMSGPAQGLYIDPKKLKIALDFYYSLAGWDLLSGWPRREKLIELGLEEYGEMV